MRIRVLVVEDTLDTRQLLEMYLTMEGFDVVTAIDGIDGISKAVSESPDVIVTDINMPRLDGVEMIKQLRAKDLFRSLKVIAMTAYGSGPAREASEAGADLVLRKPILFDSIAETIRKLVA
ncbi:MAG TPA: response regulator [Blastocatellia bacterium]|nr:response regulator [Blastocatellia bacterium]